MHYYQFNIGDYKSHTDHLEMLEDLAFRRMMDWCYLHEEPLPLDINEIAKKISMRKNIDAIKYVLDEFFVETEDGYVNSRIQKELYSFKVKSDKARKSAEARWNKKQTHNEGNANALQTHNEGNAKHKPLNINHKPLTNKQEPILKDIEAKASCENENRLSPKQVVDIFNYWCGVMGKSISTSKLTPKRDKAIKARLKEGYTIEQIKQAIDGCRNDPFSMGQNDRQKPFNDIELICRTGEKLESFFNNKAQIQQFSRATQATIDNLLNTELD